MVEFHILGPLEVRDEGRLVELGAQAQRLLAALVSRPNQAVSSETLADELWDEEDARRRATSALPVQVSRLRDRLGHDRIETAGGGYRLRVEPGELDAERFARMSEDGMKALTAGAPERAARLLRGALDMWDGEPFGGVKLGAIAEAEAVRMEENRRAAHTARMAADLDAGRHKNLVGELSAVLHSRPTDEAVAVLLMVALYRCERTADALDVYRRMASALNTELGLTPGPVLRQTEKRIFDQDDSLQVSEPAAASGGRVPLPPVLASLPPNRVELVGRAAEAERLRGAIAEVAAGARRIVLIEGAAGIGKTRLAIEAALAAHEAGFAVGWGASAEGLSASYGIWHDALSHLESQLTDERIAEHMEAYGNTISNVLPWLDRRSSPSFERDSSTAASMLSTPSEEPDLLFAGVTGLLRALCSDQPVTIVLDDVQWANPQSLRLLRYIAAHAPDAPLLIVATFRDRGMPATYPVRALESDLRRLPDAEPAYGLGPGGPVVTMELRPLDRSEVRALVTALAGHDIGPGGHALADALADETGGIPLFVREMVRHLSDSHAVEDDPETGWRLRREISEEDLPRDVVMQRVEELGRDAHAVLSAASVVGGSFDARLVTRLVELDEDGVEAALEAAGRRNVLKPATAPGSYAFEHACFQHSLYAELPPGRRARFHVAVAQALEETGQGDPSTLAHHWVTAGDPRYADQAVHYARGAGERALGQLAPEDAVHWFELARDRIRDDDPQLCDVLTRLGVAERQVGRDFGKTLSEASRLAERIGDHRRLARAVVANTAGPFGAAGHADEDRIGWLSQALAELPADDPEAPLLRAVLGKELYFGGRPAAGTDECRRAVEEARARYARLASASGDAPVYAKRELAGVLAYATAIDPITPPDDDAAREHSARFAQLAELAKELDDPELRFKVASERFIRAMHLGYPDELDESLTTMEDVARSGVPILRWTALWSASARRLVAGDLDAAESLAEEAAAFAQSRCVANGEVVALGQRAGIALERGTLGKLADEAARLAAEHPYLPLLRLGPPAIAAETGHLEAAAARFREIVADGYNFPYVQTRAACFARCADIALRLGDRGRYQELYEALLPYMDQFATPSGISTHGSVRLSLGRLATALGWEDKAADHFAAARAAHTHLGAPLLLARTDLAEGEALIERQPAKALGLLAAARNRAAEHGGTATVEAAEAHLERATERCEQPSSALPS